MSGGAGLNQSQITQCRIILETAGLDSNLQNRSKCLPGYETGGHLHSSFVQEKDSGGAGYTSFFHRCLQVRRMDEFLRVFQ